VAPLQGTCALGVAPLQGTCALGVAPLQGAPSSCRSPGNAACPCAVRCSSVGRLVERKDKLRRQWGVLLQCAWLIRTLPLIDTKSTAQLLQGVPSWEGQVSHGLLCYVQCVCVHVCARTCACACLRVCASGAKILSAKAGSNQGPWGYLLCTLTGTRSFTHVGTCKILHARWHMQNPSCTLADAKSSMHVVICKTFLVCSHLQNPSCMLAFETSFMDICICKILHHLMHARGRTHTHTQALRNTQTYRHTFKACTHNHASHSYTHHACTARAHTHTRAPLRTCARVCSWRTALMARWRPSQPSWPPSWTSRRVSWPLTAILRAPPRSLPAGACCLTAHCCR